MFIVFWNWGSLFNRNSVKGIYKIGFVLGFSCFEGYDLGFQRC